MSLSIDNTDHTAKGEDNRIAALTAAVEELQAAAPIVQDFNYSQDEQTLFIKGDAELSTDNYGTPLFVESFSTDTTNSVVVNAAQLYAHADNPTGHTLDIQALIVTAAQVGVGGVDDMWGLIATSSNSGGGVAVSVTGAEFIVSTNGDTTKQTGVEVLMQASGAGTVVTDGYGFRFEGVGASGGAEYTRLHGVYVPDITRGGVGVASSFAVHVEDQGAGLTNFAVKTEGGRICHNNTPVPASASDSGSQGEIAWDSGFVYVCVADNTWKRAAIATW